MKHINSAVRALSDKYKEIQELREDHQVLKRLAGIVVLPQERALVQKNIEEIEQKIRLLEGAESGGESFESILSSAATNLDELIAQSAARTEFILENFIVKNEITMIASRPSEGKSLTAMAICAEFLRKDPAAKVVYFDLDNSKDTIASRNIKYLHENFSGRFNLLHGSDYDAAAAGNLLAKFSQVELKNTLFILDSIKNFIAGDRDKNKDVSEFMKTVKALRDAGATVVFLHHTNKPQRDMQPNYAGSSAFLEDCSNAFILERNADKKAFIFKPIKSRIGQLEPQAFMLDLSQHLLKQVSLVWATESAKDAETIAEIEEFLRSKGEATYSQIRNFIFSEGIEKNPNKISEILSKYSGLRWSKKKLKEHNKSIYALIN